MAPSIDVRDLGAALPSSPKSVPAKAASGSKPTPAKRAVNLIDDYQDFFYGTPPLPLLPICAMLTCAMTTADRHSKADEGYPHKALLPTFPNDPQPPLDGNTPFDDRAAYSKARGGWENGPLSKRATIEECIPNIGSEITGIDLRTLSNAEKDDLALLVAERGVVVVRDQHAMTMHDQLDLGRYFGHLHKHATTGVPADPAFSEVHVVYTDSAKRPPSSAFSKLDLWHSDVTYELQPPGITSLRLLQGPRSGGDTMFASNYALYDSLSPGMQKYLEGLFVVHSAHEQAEGNKRAGQFVRREPIESIHPLVRVNPVTGWKSIFLNRGFARYIVGIPKVRAPSSFLPTI